jgi:Pentapeptide repeats (9 copies)
MRPSYDESFAILKDRVEMTGDPRPGVTHPPRHDDENPGPSLFRVLVEDVSLAGLTLPGLYVARSELRRVSFRASDLRLSAFNWSDVSECDFGDADLSRTDLRACRFVQCIFSAADLSEADLRGSTFEACAFDRATMRRTKLHRRRALLGLLKRGPDQEGLPLSADQRSEIAWSEEAPEPGGG